MIISYCATIFHCSKKTKPLRISLKRLTYCSGFIFAHKKALNFRSGLLAAELGFEPRQTESESVVLPLHNSATRIKIIAAKTVFVKCDFIGVGVRADGVQLRLSWGSSDSYSACSSSPTVIFMCGGDNRRTNANGSRRTVFIYCYY